MKTLEEQLVAVKEDGWSIQYIENPYLEAQLEAIKISGSLIRYIKDPCLEVQLEAVKQSRFAILFIKYPSIEIRKAHFLCCLKDNIGAFGCDIKDLDSVWVQNMIDCKDILE